jgi:hypothetical protein
MFNTQDCVLFCNKDGFKNSCACAEVIKHYAMKKYGGVGL